MSEETADALIVQARDAQAAERYKDMLQYMTLVVKSRRIMDENELSLLSIAFKKRIHAKRYSLGITKFILRRDTVANTSHQRMRNYKKKIKAQLRDICYNGLHLLDNYLLVKNYEPKMQILFYKMKGDLNRYLVPIIPENKKEDTATQGYLAYQEAYEKCQLLCPDDVLTLGVIRNLNVFHRKVFKDEILAGNLLSQVLQFLRENMKEDDTIPIVSELDDKLPLGERSLSNEYEAENITVNRSRVAPVYITNMDCSEHNNITAVQIEGNSNDDVENNYKSKLLQELDLSVEDISDQKEIMSDHQSDMDTSINESKLTPIKVDFQKNSIQELKSVSACDQSATNAMEYEKIDKSSTNMLSAIVYVEDQLHISTCKNNSNETNLNYNTNSINESKSNYKHGSSNNALENPELDEISAGEQFAICADRNKSTVVEIKSESKECHDEIEVQKKLN